MQDLSKACKLRGVWQALLRSSPALAHAADHSPHAPVQLQRALALADVGRAEDVGAKERLEQQQRKQLLRGLGRVCHCADVDGRRVL